MRRVDGGIETRKIVIEIADRDDDAQAGYHTIKHPIPNGVIAQTFTSEGAHVPLPGAGRSWRQEASADAGTVYVPQLNEKFYPLTVVVIG
jgi:hypothetical protein